MIARWEKLRARMSARLEDRDEVTDVHKVKNLLSRAVAPAQAPSFFRYLLSTPFRKVRDRVELGAVAMEFPSGAHYREFRHSFDELRTLQTQVTFYGSLRLLLSVWRIFHVVLAILLVVMITAHIGVSLYLGYTWIGR